VEISSTNSIQQILVELLDKKSRRDRVQFTSSKLAQALNVKRSLIQRLIHPDPLKRVTNPRIETLQKIVSFFQAEGFNLSLDDFLKLKTSTVIDVQNQKIGVVENSLTIPVYSLSDPFGEQVGVIDVKLTVKANNIIALYSDYEIKPIFQRGSIFIVDRDKDPIDDSLVAIIIDNDNRVLIRKFQSANGIRKLKSFEDNDNVIILKPSMRYQIIGVVIQINART
jgi:hypothetical protein